MQIDDVLVASSSWLRKLPIRELKQQTFLSPQTSDFRGGLDRQRRIWREILIGSLRFYDGNVNDNATNERFDWLMKKNSRAARAARFLVQCFDVVY